MLGHPSEPLPSSYTAIALGPSSQFFPQGSVAWGDSSLSSSNRVRRISFRTQDQPAGSKGRKVAAKGWCACGCVAVVILSNLPMCVCL